MIRMPVWRLPLMEPPRASTMKLTKNLHDVGERCKKRNTWQDREKDRQNHTTDTSEEDEAHAVINKYPNKERKKRESKDKEQEQDRQMRSGEC